MRFRFTLFNNLDIVTTTSAQTLPVDLPPLEDWTNNGTGKDWIISVVPEIDLDAIDSLSKNLRSTPFVFQIGKTYKVIVIYSKTYFSGPQVGIHTITLRVTDVSNAPEASNTIATSVNTSTGSIELQFIATATMTYLQIQSQEGGDVVNVQITGITATVTGLITTEGPRTLEINEPDGWADSTLKLSRDKDFHSLIEFFEGSFIFYGTNGLVNGGFRQIKRWEREFGPDAPIGILIDWTIDNSLFTRLFTGQLDVSLAEEMPDNKIRVPIIRDDFWAKFFSRKDTAVDLQATVDLDGADITPISPIELSLISQRIRYIGAYNWIESVTYPDEASMHGLQLDWDESIIDDFKKFTLPRVPFDIGNVSGIALNLIGLIEAPWAGDYHIEARVEFSVYSAGTWVANSSGFQFIIQKIGQINIVDEYTGINSIDTYGSDTVGVSEINAVIKLAKGDQVAIFANRLSTSQNYTIFGQRRLDWKTSVELATTGNITLSGEQTIDNVMTSSDRVLVKNQGNPEENGIYVSNSGTWLRASDSNTAAELINAAVYVDAGDTQIDTAWRQTEQNLTLGVDPNSWVYIIPSDERFKEYPGTTVENFLNVTADTTYKDTRAVGFLVHDSAAAILKSHGLGVSNPFYSPVFGGTQTNSRQYPSDGCYWNHANAKGLHIRGYSFAEKAYFMSFMQWWRGIYPIFNTGLSYEEIEGDGAEIIAPSIAALADWEDASGGSFPGNWVYTFPARPHVVIAGDGATEGFTVGACATEAGEQYRFATLIQIIVGGVVIPDAVVTWALLDSSFNELDTVSFHYITPGYKLENFFLSPSADGAYFACRITNDTVTFNVTFRIELASNKTTNQALLNDEFTDTSVWVDDGSGSPWVITGGAATLDLPSASSSILEQTISGYGPGDYYLESSVTSTNVGGGESISLGFTLYDEDDNVITSAVSFISGNNTTLTQDPFTSAVGVAKIEIVAVTGTGSDMNLSIPFVRLYAPLAQEAPVVADNQVIEVNPVEDYYDEDFVVRLSNIREITRNYDTDKAYNKIEIGYTEWKAEAISGIDDPQTKHTYATRFQKIGQAISLLSDWIAASIPWEETRRASIEKSKDYKFDDNTFIVRLNQDEISPDSFVPEFDERFSSITNLFNSDRRYNIALSVAHNFLRFRNWFNGGLQSYLDSVYRFVSGEGNYKMTSTMIPPSPSCSEEDFDGVTLAEDQNIDVTEEIVHLINHYTIESYLSMTQYQRCVRNRKKAIGISLTDSNHKAFFIEELSFKPVKGSVTITGWTKEYFDIHVIEGPAPTQECLPTTECDNALTDELGDILTDENGVCLTF